MLFHQQEWMNALVSPAFFFGVPAVWVFCVFWLIHVMMTKRAVQVKFIMQIYNVVQIVVCGYMVWGLAPAIGFPNFFGINTEFDEQGEWFVFVHYLSKYLDWFDTLWIILNKKRGQLSFLHIYHHGTIVSVWGMLLQHNVGSGPTRYGAFINSLTHVIMYSHYLWTSFGLKNPFKRYITMWQISQFYSCLVHAFLVLFLDTTPVHAYAWIQVLYQITMVYLFSNMLSWVPPCVPDFTAKKGETSISCMTFCSGQEDDFQKADERKQIEMAWKERYVVIRGEAYDITNFQHPGGSQMIDLAVGRDATVMFESAHLRSEVTNKALASLPKFSVAEIEKRGYNFGRKETRSTPSKSALYETIRKRVVEEVIKPRGPGVGARGVGLWRYFFIVAAFCYAAQWFVLKPSIESGAALGLALAWIGVGVQHTANHGALSTSTTWNYFMGILLDLFTGGSSIVWRYHHQVYLHSACNDIEKIPASAMSARPIVRLEAAQKLHFYHRFQAIYAPVAFCLLWTSVQLHDLTSLLNGQSYLSSFKGTKSLEIVWSVFLKLIHFCWIVVLPYQLHGLEACLYPWMTLFSVGGFVFTTMFIMTHSLARARALASPNPKADWAVQQIETNASWGSCLDSFFFGSINLQIEHSLFPCMAHNLYPSVQVIVMEECAKRGIKYTAYSMLLTKLIDLVSFLHYMGQPSSRSMMKRKDDEAQDESAPKRKKTL